MKRYLLYHPNGSPRIPLPSHNIHIRSPPKQPKEEALRAYFCRYIDYLQLYAYLKSVSTNLYLPAELHNFIDGTRYSYQYRRLLCVNIASPNHQMSWFSSHKTALLGHLIASKKNTLTKSTKNHSLTASSILEAGGVLSVILYIHTSHVHTFNTYKRILIISSNWYQVNNISFGPRIQFIISGTFIPDRRRVPLIRDLFF